MFGYITVNTDELKVKELHRYEAFYCGLCRMLKKRSGHIARLTLTYDMTFLAILLGALYESECTQWFGKCVLHPLKKKSFIWHKYVEYAADMNTLLVYYNLEDDWQDEHNIQSRILQNMLKSSVKRIKKSYPQQTQAVRYYMSELTILEEQENQNLEQAAVLTGEMLGQIYAVHQDCWRDSLYQIGFYIGKFVYYMDAFEDIEKDMHSGGYNPLKALYADDDFEKKVYQILLMQISEACRTFEGLPIINEDTGILRNVLYAGVWSKFRLISQKRKQKAEAASKTGESNE